ncbi:D-alanyl-D-alanine carboxypeptidase/D-alanyl-D-alanine-endopeptidase [Arcicella sp. LKC2W]|uniref:D-alanyl-D-alanine carboxypeptidase/D-alanyl-D-alanine endopeptidase n=1 Tax=Arcicella sp. LKC2W TaxID=2984198 RepID=UPI002B21A6A1|nr:D-alanyl-D-alanine carboxypeptidase/D-alanyl-D-alanine-endopeptidase [Arcicella sp. LKC2W]MEA5457591.1 D-alanyl-D-alanine carboxypeptidase/D-alanyl-D-alanine-endopeptidase [Arcicella sp. LKC2W]
MKLFLLSIFKIILLQNQPQTADSVKVLSPKDVIQRKIDSLVTSPFLENGFIGLSIKSVNSDLNIVEYNAKKSLTPASTLKLVSSATALMALGSDFKYTTTLEYSGEIKDSILTGNIIIKGSGDPSLGSWRFKNQPDYKQLTENWAKKIKSLGIKEIRGRVFGDGSFFDENVISDGWIWGDMGNYYGAGAYGLNMNENLYWATFNPAKYMENAPLVKTAPDLPYYTKINRVLTDKAGTGDQVNIYSTPYQDVLIMEGFVPTGDNFSVKGSIPDPALFSAFFLHKKLEELNVKISESPISILEANKKNISFQKPLQSTTIDSLLSPPLKDLVKECNLHSINLYAEAFLKTPSIILNLGSTTDAAVKGLKQIWLTKGVKFEGLKIKDGSGLAPANGITPNNMTDILKAMFLEKSFDAFYESIPVVGVSGTVANLGKKSKAVGNVHAKSGSIDGVKAYSGYFTARNGEMMCFSMMLNKYNSDFGSATKELEKLMILMVEL